MIADDTPITDSPSVTDQTQEVEMWKQKYLRALADYQNLEKRTVERLQTDRQMAARHIVTKFLSIIDVLYKAQEALADEGLGLALKQLDDMLKSERVTKMDVIGQAFDPISMECIEMIGDPGDETVVEEIRPGYLMHDVVIRPAQVKVGKKQKEKKNNS